MKGVARRRVGMLVGLILLGVASRAPAQAAPGERTLDIRCNGTTANYVAMRPSGSNKPYIKVADHTPVVIGLPPPGVADSRRYDVVVKDFGWLVILSEEQLGVGPAAPGSGLDGSNLIHEFHLRYEGLNWLNVGLLCLLGAAAVAGVLTIGRRTEAAEQRAEQAERDKEVMASTRFGDSELPHMLGRKLRTAHDRDLEILRKVGNGNMGAVFEAAWREDTSGREERWAVKVPFRDIVVKPNARRRFLREAEICNNVHHSGLVQVLDWGTFTVPEDPEAGDWPFLVMEMMDGQTLRDAIEREGKSGLPIALVTAWMRDMARALQEMHEASIVHRDLKPDNVFVTRAKRLKIGDFGLSGRTDRHSVTQSGDAFGTPLYMSPEHLEAQTTTGASDIYSFGVISYEMLCGEPPFMAETTVAVLNRMLTEEPEPIAQRRSDVPEALTSLVTDMMERDPSYRPDVPRILARLDEMEGRAPKGSEA